MSQPILLRDGGSIGGPCSVGRIHVSEPTHAGTLVVKDGPTTILTLTYAGPGNPEPVRILNPPLQFSTGCQVANSMGGVVHVYVQGASGFGY